MKKTLLLFLVAAVAFASAHGLEGEESVDVALPVAEQTASNILNAMAFSLTLILILVIYALVREEKITSLEKKAVFAAISILFIATTVYSAATLFFYNTNSYSQGPVHWHADFEIYACGEQLVPKESSGWTTRVGSLLLHHHGDMRIHVEGVIVERQDVSLHRFFDSIGWSMSNSQLTLETQGGVVSFKNGNLCDGKPGVWKAYKKNWTTGGFEKLENPEDYVISPFTDVPPGDFLKFVFGEENGG